jgi:hypothetical protein
MLFVAPSEVRTPLVAAGVIIGSVQGGLVVGVLFALWSAGKLPFVGASSPGKEEQTFFIILRNCVCL